jgi:hypothetical protein
MPARPSARWPATPAPTGLPGKAACRDLVWLSGAAARHHTARQGKGGLMLPAGPSARFSSHSIRHGHQVSRHCKQGQSLPRQESGSAGLRDSPAACPAVGGTGGGHRITLNRGQLIMAMLRGHFIPLKCGHTRPALTGRRDRPYHHRHWSPPGCVTSGSSPGAGMGPVICAGLGPANEPSASIYGKGYPQAHRDPAGTDHGLLSRMVKPSRQIGWAAMPPRQDGNGISATETSLIPARTRHGPFSAGTRQAGRRPADNPLTPPVDPPRLLSRGSVSGHP